MSSTPTSLQNLGLGFCFVAMSDHEPCGRPVAPLTTTRAGRQCLMHSTSRTQPEQIRFDAEVDAIMRGQSAYNRAKQGIDFSGFCFQNADFSGKRFAGPVFFTDARFEGNAHFSNTTFEAAVSFQSAVLTALIISHASFISTSDFSNSNFYGDFLLDTTKIGGDLNFDGTTFHSGVHLLRLTCSGQLRFQGAEFLEPLRISEVRVQEQASFRQASCRGEVIVRDSVFSQGCDFSGARFAEAVQFLGLTVASADEDAGAERLGVTDLTYATFQKPDKLLFRNINAGARHGLRLRILHCDVTGASFEGVVWEHRGGRMVLQDELDTRSIAEDHSKEPARRLAYEGTATAYRRLTTLFEESRQTDLAEDCFRGSMEMMRLAARRFSLKRIALRLYAVASAYGSSYGRAAVVVVLLLVLFGLLHTWLGVDPRPLQGPSGLPHSTPEGIRSFGRGLFHSLEAGTLQRDTRYVSHTALGQAVGILEALVLPAQFGLFLLALNRRFRR